MYLNLMYIFRHVQNNLSDFTLSLEFVESSKRTTSFPYVDSLVSFSLLRLIPLPLFKKYLFTTHDGEVWLATLVTRAQNSTFVFC